MANDKRSISFSMDLMANKYGRLVVYDKGKITLSSCGHVRLRGKRKTIYISFRGLWPPN